MAALACRDWSARRVAAGTSERGRRAGEAAPAPPVDLTAPPLPAPGRSSWSVRFPSDPRLGHLLLARHRAVTGHAGVAHFARRCQPRSGPARSLAVRVAERCASALALACLVAIAACASPAPSAEVAARRADRPGRDRRRDGAHRLGTTAARPSRSGCRRATRPGSRPAAPTSWPPPWPTGTTATSDPIHLGRPLVWRPVKAIDPTGETPVGPDYFVAWDPEGGRFATLAGDLLSGDGDPASSSSTRRSGPRSRSRSTARSWPPRRSGSTPTAWSS